jgi:NAD(P)-dependent dehydrogenase (short-subunit alcohol dehydrogenase family)
MTFATYPSLAERVVFVTGGASGIGAEIVRAFVGQGSCVAFVGVQRDAAHELMDGLRAAAHAPLFLPCDLTDIAALQDAIAETRERLGPIAILVNNAGNDDRHNVEDVTPDYWDRVQAINIRPQFFAAQAVLPHMREIGSGSIINLSSIAWRGGGPTMAAYTSAKAAVLGLTNSLARAVGADNIRVNAIEPGAVITDRQRRLWFTEPGSVEAVVQKQAIPKILLADEIARMALFLAADDSRMITKQSITVDAGLR